MVRHKYIIEGDKYICSKCGHEFGPGESYFDECKTEVKEPSVIDKGVHFLSAFYDHIKDGMEKCTQEEIDNRFKICKECPFYKDNKCLKCGCNLNQEQIFFNKLAWKSEHCPIGKWEKL